MLLQLSKFQELLLRNEASIKPTQSLKSNLSNNGILSAGPYLRVDVEGAVGAYGFNK